MSDATEKNAAGPDASGSAETPAEKASSLTHEEIIHEIIRRVFAFARQEGGGQFAKVSREFIQGVAIGMQRKRDEKSPNQVKEYH